MTVTDRFNWRDAILAAGTLALLALFAVGIETVVILRHLDKDRAAARQSLSGTTQLLRDRVTVTTKQLNFTVGQFGDAVKKWNDSSVEQAKYFDEGMKGVRQANTDLEKLGHTADELKDLLSNTNTQLNRGLLPALTEQVNALGKTTEALTTDAKHLQQAIDSANKAVSNPDVPAALEQIRGTAGNVNKTTGDIYAMVDDYKRNLEKPKNLAWKIFSALTGLGAKAGQISTLAK